MNKKKLKKLYKKIKDLKKIIKAYILIKIIPKLSDAEYDKLKKDNFRSRKKI